MTGEPDYRWRTGIADAELSALTGAPPGWWDRIRSHSLGWVGARADGELVGFVNVATDGGAHAFLVDTTVHPDHRRRGIGSGLVRVAARGATDAGCAWLHVDFEPRLRDFYLTACGFAPTDAGLIRLSDAAPP